MRKEEHLITLEMILEKVQISRTRKWVLYLGISGSLLMPNKRTSELNMIMNRHLLLALLTFFNWILDFREMSKSDAVALSVLDTATVRLRGCLRSPQYYIYHCYHHYLMLGC